MVSELRKVSQCKADPGFMRWAEGVVSNDLYLSVITVQELEIGVMLAERRDPDKGRILRFWLENKVLQVFRHRIIPIDRKFPGAAPDCMYLTPDQCVMSLSQLLEWSTA